MKFKPKSIGGAIRRAERRAIVKWIRFAHAHQNSVLLPFALFFILFLDGFLIIIPSVVCLIAATMISPQRWWIFGIIFAVASLLNGIVLYFIGRSVPVDQLVSYFSFFHAEFIWDSAREALQNFGAYATLIGAIVGAPTQIIMALIGAAGGKFSFAATMVFIGQFSKAIVIAALTRYGWLKLEKKFGTAAEAR